MKIDLLGLQLDSPLAHPGARNFRPPSWPPPPDWAPIVDKHGNAQCVYADSVWPLDVWAGSALKINFGDGVTARARMDPKNAALLRQCATWFMWGPRGCKTASLLMTKVYLVKRLFAACSKAEIVATDLRRFDRIIDQIAASLPPSMFGYAISIFHDLLAAREELGFCLLDQAGIARLSRLSPKHEPRQTPYIPPRIWSYQVTRMHECLQDFERNRTRIEDCFDFCVNAYAKNFGTLKLAMEGGRDRYRLPFSKLDFISKYEYLGVFKETAARFGLVELFEKWVGPLSDDGEKYQINKFSSYLDVVSTAALSYIINFSLMRVEEAWGLRSDCVLVEQDENFGVIYMLRGQTTKTSKDSDARWPVTKSVLLAVECASHIASLRMKCARESSHSRVTLDDEKNPYLFSFQYEPWSQGRRHSYQMRPVIKSYGGILKNFPRLLDSSAISLSDEDVRVARLITPDLDDVAFQVNRPWSFAWHQLRRTGAVNMLSSEMVDETSLQVLLKHQSRVMSLYYGRNHSRLALSEATRRLILQAMYEEIARSVKNLSLPQFVSPNGLNRKDAIINFISESDSRSIEKSARKGRVNARRIRAGFCVNHSPCPYGGVESIAHCLGADDGSKGCPDLMVDVTKVEDMRRYESVVNSQLMVVDPESPRHKSLRNEKLAIERFYAIA